VGIAISGYPYPNPATGNTMNLLCDLCESSSVVVSVYNVAAEKVATYNYAGFSGANIYSLDIGGLAHGVYYLMIRSNGPSGSRKSNIDKFAVIR
jgi:hypothetical protein